jgi:predicted dehydrogenase
MSKVRIAVVGAGWISQEAFLPAVSQTGNAEVTAIVSGNADKARKLAHFYGIADVYGYDQFDAMANSGKVDAVYVATPNSSHCEYALKAAKHRLHALVEKPLATSTRDAERMIAAAKAAGVFLMTAYRLHNDPATIRVAQMVESGIIGDARFFSSVFTFQSAPDNHRLKASHWGGPLQDLGVYCLNAARHVFREDPLRAMSSPSFGHNDPRFKEVEEGVAVTLEFSKGRIAQFYCGFGTDAIDTLQVAGTNGSITLNNAYRFAMPRKLTLLQNDQSQIEDFAETDNFSGMISYFADCIQNGTAPMNDGAEGLADMAAMVAIEAAGKTRACQAVPQLSPFRSHDSSMIRSFPQAREKLLV